MTELLPLTPDELLTTPAACASGWTSKRPVERDIVEECIAIALRRRRDPTGRPGSGCRSMIRDKKVATRRPLPRRVQCLAPRSANYAEGDIREHRRDAVTASSVHLRDHLHEVPVLVVVFQEGRVEALTSG